ncbi:MAG: hypothetical protein ACI9JN_001047, partial [Bacteroidia bacterium]
DFEEIRSAKLYNETYAWEIDATGPVGRLSPDSLVKLVHQARERIDQTEENLRFLNVCEQAYSTCKTFADATRYIVHHFFEDTGIVVLDADDSFLKKQFISEFEADLIEHSVKPVIDQSIRDMKRFGVKAPINTRNINTFYVTNDNRTRIEQTDTGYKLVDDSLHFTQQQLLTELKDKPENFSPNALLRPIYQQRILPNINYICGASEFVYWLELRGAINQFQLTYPALTIRKSVFFLSDKNIQKLDKEDVSLHMLFLSQENFRKKMLVFLEVQMDELGQKIEHSQSILLEAKTLLESFQPTKSTKLEKLYNQLFTEFQVQQLQVINARSQSNETLNKLIKIKASVFDMGKIQERDKSILNMIQELEISLNCYRKNHNQFMDHRLLTLISN